MRFPASFPDNFLNLEVTEEKAKKFFQEMKDMILKFKKGSVDVFLERFRQIAISFSLIDHKIAIFNDDGVIQQCVTRIISRATNNASSQPKEAKRARTKRKAKSKTRERVRGGRRRKAKKEM